MSEINIRPLHDRVIVRAEVAQEFSAGGIAIAPNATSKPMEGVVLAHGNGKMLENGKLVEMAVKVGDKVMFGQYSGEEITVDSQKVLIMKEEDIIGIVT